MVMIRRATAIRRACLPEISRLRHAMVITTGRARGRIGILRIFRMAGAARYYE